MNIFEKFENSCKARAYDASLKFIEQKIRELQDPKDEQLVAGLMLAKTIMKSQLRFMRYTKSK